MTSKTVTTQLTLSQSQQALAFSIKLLEEHVCYGAREAALRAIAAYFGYKIEKL